MVNGAFKYPPHEVVVGSLLECSELAQHLLANAVLERKLSEVNARFHSFLANTHNAVWCYECSPPIPISLSFEDQFARLLEAQLVDCNVAYVALHGATDVEALLGQKLQVLNRARLAVLRQLFEQVVSAGYVLDETTLEAGGRHLIAAAQGIIDEGALVRIWGSYSDITAKVETEAQNALLEKKLLKAQKMDSLGTMAGSVAHDFNNVLASILAEADLAVHAIASGDDLELRQSFKVIKKSAEKGAALTRRLLSFTQQHPSPRHPMRVDLMLHELWPMMRRLIDESVSLKLETTEPLWALIDPSQLEQIIITLVVNARDAIGPRAGDITVRTQAVFLTEHERKANPWVGSGPFVELTVSDTGPGLEVSARERIFEPYFTTRPSNQGGTGLGLSMAYGILKQHAGFIDVKSEPGQGAVFRLVLPRAEESERQTFIVARRPLPSAPANERVLLVEDEPDVRESTRRILESGGYRVVTAADGYAASDLLRCQGPFGVLVLDVLMPGTSGPALYASLAEPRPPVLFTSGANEAAPDGALFGGAGRGFLAKPYGREGLLWALRGVLDSRD